MNSKLWTVSVIQWIKGLAIFILPTVIATVSEMINGSQSIDLQLIGKVALISALSYLSITFSQDSKGVPLGSADKE